MVHRFAAASCADCFSEEEIEITFNSDSIIAHSVNEVLIIFFLLLREDFKKSWVLFYKMGTKKVRFAFLRNRADVAELKLRMMMLFLGFGPFDLSLQVPSRDARKVMVH